MDQIDEFVRDSRELIGKEAVDVQPGRTVATWHNIKAIFVGALGDENPLYNDAWYAGCRTHYGAMLAHPTFLLSVRTPISNGALSSKNYGLVPFQSGVDLEWFDVIRTMDRFRSELKLCDVAEKSGTYFVKPKRVAVLTSEASYWNQHGALVGKARGEGTMIPLDIGKEMLIDREVYVYSDEEIARIEKDTLDAAPPRGIKPLYWSEVNVGDEVLPIVKPLYIAEVGLWASAEGKKKSVLVGDSVYRDLKNRPGDVRTLSDTNWPYWDAFQNSEDFWGCRLSGMPAPFGRGTLSVALTADSVTNWMSDEGFLRRLSVEISKPYIYGDTMWIRGRVIDKYKEKLGGEMYRAVDVKIEGINQLKEIVASATATVYLSEAGWPVTLPVPK